jgi:uncharacterized membrane protein YidH (DUF202 family)
MKKYLILPLIFIAFIGMFTPFAQINADAYDDCMAQAYSSGTDTSRCESFRNSANSSSLCSGKQGILNLICRAHQILNAIVPVLVALGVVYFVWGVVQYMIGGEEEAKKKGKDTILYGVIGLAVIVGIWGLVNIVVNTFGLGGQQPPLPTVGSVSGTCLREPKPTFQDLATYATCIITTSVIPLIFALAIAMFIWGVVQFVINSDEEAKKTKGKQFMLWGIIALAVMVSVWGLVNILTDTFGIKGGFIPQVSPTRSVN